MLQAINEGEQMRNTIDGLIYFLKTCNGVIHSQTEGLTMADSLIPPPFGGNCLNWVLGHILTHRDSRLFLLGSHLELNEQETALYQRGSAPLGPESKPLELRNLLNLLDHSVREVETSLVNLHYEELAQQVTYAGRLAPLGDTLAFLQWHETYHVGQLELLRNLAGKNDKII